MHTDQNGENAKGKKFLVVPMHDECPRSVEDPSRELDGARSPTLDRFLGLRPARQRTQSASAPALPGTRGGSLAPRHDHSAIDVWGMARQTAETYFSQL